MGKSTNLIQIDAMAYGAARQYVSNLLMNVAGNVGITGFLGQYSDEVLMGAADYLIAKHTSGFISEVAKKGLVIENARVGETIVGSLGMSPGSNNSGLASYNSGFSY